MESNDQNKTAVRQSKTAAKPTSELKNSSSKRILASEAEGVRNRVHTAIAEKARNIKVTVNSALECTRQQPTQKSIRKQEQQTPVTARIQHVTEDSSKKKINGKTIEKNEAQHWSKVASRTVQNKGALHEKGGGMSNNGSLPKLAATAQTEIDERLETKPLVDDCWTQHAKPASGVASKQRTGETRAGFKGSEDLHSLPDAVQKRPGSRALRNRRRKRFEQLSPKSLSPSESRSSGTSVVECELLQELNKTAELSVPDTHDGLLIKDALQKLMHSTAQLRSRMSCKSLKHPVQFFDESAIDNGSRVLNSLDNSSDSIKIPSSSHSVIQFPAATSNNDSASACSHCADDVLVESGDKSDTNGLTMPDELVTHTNDPEMDKHLPAVEKHVGIGKKASKCRKRPAPVEVKPLANVAHRGRIKLFAKQKRERGLADKKRRRVGFISELHADKVSASADALSSLLDANQNQAGDAVPPDNQIDNVDMKTETEAVENATNAVSYTDSSQLEMKETQLNGGIVCVVSSMSQARIMEPVLQNSNILVKSPLSNPYDELIASGETYSELASEDLKVSFVVSSAGIVYCNLVSVISNSLSAAPVSLVEVACILSVSFMFGGTRLQRKNNCTFLNL